MKYFKVKKIKLLHNKHSYLLLLKQDNKKDRQPNKSFKVYSLIVILMAMLFWIWMKQIVLLIMLRVYLVNNLMMVKKLL